MRIPQYLPRQLPARPGFPQGGRSIQPQGLRGTARAIRRAGATFSGAMGQLVDLGGQWARQYEAGEYSKAITRATAQMNEFEAGLKTRGDWQNYLEEYAEIQGEIYQGVSGGITHLRARQSFDTWFQAKNVDMRDRIREQATARMLNQQAADLAVSIDEAVKERDAELINELLRSGVEGGLLLPTQAEKTRIDALETITYGRVLDEAMEKMRRGEDAQEWVLDESQTQETYLYQDAEGNWKSVQQNISSQQREQIIGALRSEESYQDKQRRDKERVVLEQTTERVWDHMNQNGFQALTDSYLDSLPIPAGGTYGKIWWQDLRMALEANEVKLRTAATAAEVKSTYERTRGMLNEMIDRHEPGTEWITENDIYEYVHKGQLDPDDAPKIVDHLTKTRDKHDVYLKLAKDRLYDLAEEGFYQKDDDKEMTANKRVAQELSAQLSEMVGEERLHGKEIQDRAEEIIDDYRMRYLKEQFGQTRRWRKGRGWFYEEYQELAQRQETRRQIEENQDRYNDDYTAMVSRLEEKMATEEMDEEDHSFAVLSSRDYKEHVDFWGEPEDVYKSDDNHLFFLLQGKWRLLWDGIWYISDDLKEPKWEQARK